MGSSALAALAAWYAAQSDGDWEHQQGVSISTLDNPGWSLTVDLAGTALEGIERGVAKSERSEHDFVHCWSDGVRYEAREGPHNLPEMVDGFLSFADTHGRRR